MTAFSTVNPDLQIAWDATSLKSIQFCPRYYQYTHLDGYSGSTVDLDFGKFAASAFERFQKARLGGCTIEEGAALALRYIMEATNETETRPQWGGRYETQWHCKGETKYKNEKGNAAKCPYCHKGAFFPMPAPDICGECGSSIEVVRNYIPEHAQKNRHTLARMVVWYCLDQPEDLNDGLKPYQFPDGTLAVELKFDLPLPWPAYTGEYFHLAGYLDYIGQYADDLFSVDNKTTTKSLGDSFFDSYSPDMQFDTYDLVGVTLFPDLPLKGVLIDAAQTLVGGAKFGRHPYYKTDAQREEHWQTIEWWIKQAEIYAQNAYWPMNKGSCWKCPFKLVCSQDPAIRHGILESNFKKRPRWDPTQER